MAPCELIQRWLPVTDNNGRTRLEATWVPAQTSISIGSASRPHAA